MKLERRPTPPPPPSEVILTMSGDEAEKLHAWLKWARREVEGETVYLDKFLALFDQP